MSPHIVTCREQAIFWVNGTAGGGAILAPIPIPGVGTAGLVAVQTGLIRGIARIYGEQPTVADITAIAAVLEVGGLVVRAGVMEVLNYVPAAGWLLKSIVAFVAIQSIGRLIVEQHFEKKYPGRVFTRPGD